MKTEDSGSSSPMKCILWWLSLFLPQFPKYSRLSENKVTQPQYYRTLTKPSTKTQLHCQEKNIKITESQNHRMVGVGRDLCGSSSPTLLPKQDHVSRSTWHIPEGHGCKRRKRRLVLQSRVPLWEFGSRSKQTLISSEGCRVGSSMF